MKRNEAIELLEKGLFQSYGDNNEYWRSLVYPTIELLDQGICFRVFDMEGFTVGFIHNLKELDEILTIDIPLIHKYVPKFERETIDWLNERRDTCTEQTH